MIRPFDLRDIPLVRQLEQHGVPLDSRVALTETHRPLQEALLAYLIAGRGAPTFVLRQQRSGVNLQAFGQLRLWPSSQGKAQARLVMLATQPPGRELLLWPQLLDALAAHAGQCGAHAVPAEIADSGPHFEALRRANFVVYSRQEIWRLMVPLELPAERYWRPEQPGDQWQIQQLITSTVPRLIQQVETADRVGPGLLWLKDGNLLAYICARRGPRGVWLQLYPHPQAAASTSLLIQQAAAHYRPSPETPLYCIVRRYQEWLNRCLADLDFEPVGSQAVMVRHTIVRAPRPERVFAPVRDKVLEATTSIAQSGMKRNG